MIDQQGHDGIGPRDFIGAASLAIAFFAFSLLLMTSEDIKRIIDQPCTIFSNPLGALYLILITISLVLFIFFTLALFASKLNAFISQIYKKPIFLNLLWTVMLLNFVAVVVSRVGNLPENFRAVSVLTICAWLVAAFVALIINSIRRRWRWIQAIMSFKSMEGKTKSPTNGNKGSSLLSRLKQPGILLSVLFLVPIFLFF